MKKLLLFFMSFFAYLGYGQISEGFEGATFPPSGWHVGDNGIGLTRSWTTTTATGLGWVHAGAKSAIINKENVTGIAEDWLVTPLVNVPVNGQLSFFARSIADGEQGSVYKVKISTTSQTDQTSFVDIVTPPYTELDIINAPFEQKIIPLTAYAGTSVYIAFVMENDNGDAWIIDNVNVDRQCLQPTNLVVSGIGDTSVNLSWSNLSGATQWEIEYGPVGFTQGTGTLVTGVNTNNAYTLTGLTAATNYDFYVRPICGLYNVGPWSDSETFTTALCPASQQCDFVFRMTDDYGDGWNGNTMVVRQFGVVVVTLSLAANGPTNGDGPEDIVVPLCSGQPFELFWNTGGSYSYEVGVAIIDPLGVQIYNKPFNTGTPGTVLYSGPASCTPPTCPAPSNIVVSALTTTSGTVTWIDNAGATQWEIIIQPAGTGYPPNGATPTAIVNGTPTYDFSGFPSATSFEVYVRAICSPTDSSIWAGPRNFATLISNDECATAVTVPVNIGTACINSVTGTVLGATPSSDPNGCGGTDDDDVWFQFTATEGTHNISLVSVTGSTTDLYHVVYSGSCGSLTQLYCSDDNSSIATNLTPGQTYYIRVYTFTATAGQNTSFTLCVGTPVDCSDASAFCGETGLVYTNSVGVPSYGDIGCLSRTPNPSWYFMQVSQSGNLSFQISQVDTNGDGIDVDYIVWGPFTPAQFATSCNNLYDFPQGNTGFPNNIASCSYSFVSIENFTIPNAVIGNIYVVLITNFSGDPGTVTFTQTNLNGSGAGATNCAIVCSNNLGADQVLCADSYQIVSSNTTADQYQWFYNNTLIPGETASTLTVYQSGTYKCIVTCGINTVEDEIVVTLNPTIVPTFSTPGAICSGAANVPLSNTSINGVTGQWTLAGNPVTEISTATAGMFTYIFTPNAATFPCSPNFQMDVEILGTCTFNSFATAVWVENCTNTATDGEFYNVTGVGTDLIAPSTNVFPGTDLGVYVQNSGSLIFRGAELKSFKTATSNVCSARLNYRIYQASTAPGAFTVLNLPFFDDCTAGSFPTGGTCNTGDQKWQEVLNDTESPLDLTNYPPGDYIIEVFFDLTGDNNSTVGCDDTILVNNGGSNYVANFTIQATPTFVSTNEQCGSANGSITVSGFIPGTTYAVTYTDDAVVVGPTNYIANSSGQIIFAGLNAGTYADFSFLVNGCTILVPAPIVITNFSPSITQVTSNTEICVGGNAVFTIEGSPNFNVSYSINGGAAQSVTLDASGLATVTVTTPPAGNVVLQLININNLSCTISVTNSSTVLVNALPVATLTVVDSNICLGVGNAEFVINGTPNATVSYTINGGATQTINIGATGTATITVNLPTADVTVALTGVTLGICSNTTTGQTGTVVITSIPVPVINVTQTPVCSNQTASFIVTSPVNTQLNVPTDLFISEITDHTSGSLTYVEIYNGTGAPIDLANYRLKIYTTATGAPTCNLLLSGIIANNDVVVVKLSSSPNQGGVVPDLTFTTCAGVNNNDSIVLTTSSDVELDNWGVRGVVFTPGGGVGYNYRRNTSAVLPTMTWDPLDWTIIDWTATAPDLPDYSDVGIYSLYVTNYEYTLSNGVTTTTQSGVNFTGVAPGTYTLVATDLITGCTSNPLTFTIDPVVFANPVTTISYTTPVCILSTTDSVPNTSAVGFTSGGVFRSTAGLVIDPTTGVIDLSESVPGSYVVTYSVVLNNATCTNAGSSQFTIVITADTVPTFTQVDDLCLGAVITLPTTSDNGITGTWSPAIVDTTQTGIFTYTFTPDASFCSGPTTMDINVIGCEIPKGISPNNDGDNDNWDLSGYDIRKVEIFNRYGTKVYSKANYSDEWFGQSDNGNELPDGTYYYVIEFNDLPAKTGWVYINRQQ